MGYALQVGVDRMFDGVQCTGTLDLMNVDLVPRRLFIGPLADSYASTWFREQLGEGYGWWREQARTNPHWEILVYEVLNFTDGKRSLAEIEDAVRAEFGEVPEGTVEHILRDLEKVKLVEFMPPKTE